MMGCLAAVLFVILDGVVHYDGLGDALQNINKSLDFAMTKKSFFWFVDNHINATNKKSRLLRSEAHFGNPLPGRCLFFFLCSCCHSLYIFF